jgi:hypothetical protein
MMTGWREFDFSPRETLPVGEFKGWEELPPA